VSIIALWVLVLFETVLLLLLLRALGQLRQQGTFPRNQKLSSESQEEWGLALGELAPSFVVLDSDNRAFKTNDFQGQNRILAFILPGCSSCSNTVKALNTFLLSNHDITILVIGSSDINLNLAYAAEQDAKFSVLAPASGFDGELYRIRGVPFVFVLDELGIVRAKGAVNDFEQLQHLVTEAFTSLPVSL
jgi:peroxiredoxin